MPHAADAPASPPPAPCPQCQAARAPDATYCGDCGYVFSNDGPGPTVVPDGLIAGRYRLTRLIGERGGTARFRGEDVGTAMDPLPVVVLRQAVPPTPPSPPAESPPTPGGSVFDFTLPEDPDQATEEIPQGTDPAGWPGVSWEQSILLRAAHLSLPRLIDSFTEDGHSFLVEEIPNGTPLWDAWDSEGTTNRDRFTWLIQLAEALDRLHVAGAIVEGLRPEMVVVSPSGLAIVADLSELLPLPLRPDVQLRGGFATAPELLLNPEAVDERADLYAFGALTYALLMGRELTDLDFTLTGMPKPYTDRNPDAHPLLARLMGKTFVREPDRRFPTEDGALADATGFAELVAALESCRRNVDRARLDVAAWSTIGMMRSGNEDAVIVHHATDGRLDDIDEAALVMLADGMGGMESGEVAAGLALQSLRETLLSAPPFAPAHPITRPPTDTPPASTDADTDADSPPPARVSLRRLPIDPDAPDRAPDTHGERVAEALRAANHLVYEAARNGQGARGMGCTAEVILIDGATAVIGHVGDSRVYRMRRGRLRQVTRDQSVVSRMVELGQLTEEEAETHPRRAELQQAIGGRQDVYPEIYSVGLEPGDWLLACTDGLSNQTPLEVIESILRDSRSAEKAARRLINQALLNDANDNVTVAVVRVS
ncbi:MAG TPA: protein phosphatase 2C domain-containing protein [Gemmataceae bacterium]|nr:protein phosphatase 2C domain-containing protein [Gemmataceae bacterium]